ncbi:28S ribosomal protein S18c, mitochondrial [Ischnura elegans]|uniref:28S ribosomal protein S18c, mitochondrial n=1 Tax=Ischnura elegans TaxID=197161 RepID=UPI001ED8AD05|nr:28S ribosomal protein S18c, mitochondrial [Ischnura elegans]
MIPRFVRGVSNSLRWTLKDVPPRCTMVRLCSQLTGTSEGKHLSAKSTDDMPVTDMANPFEKEKPKCILCKYDVTPNYKNVKLLSQFVSPFTGRVYGRHITRLCKAKQNLVEREILKSRNCGLMPYYFKQPYLMKDPKLFDPENPLRPHRF